MINNKVKVIEKCPSVEDYINLRKKSGLSPRNKEGIKKALPNTWYGVHIKDNEKTVGMGRIVGDGGISFQIVDIVVLPEYQGQGLGKLIMENIMIFYKKMAPSKAYLSLIAAGNAKHLYQKYGFKEVAPLSIGMKFTL